MQRRERWLVTLLLAASSLSASPQTSSRVTLNVVAFDSHDQIVGDLATQDFQVSDQGKPQRIVSFHRNGKTTLNNVPNAPQMAPPVVILFDLQDDDIRDRGQGADEIVHALEHLESSDSLYMYLLTNQGGLEPVRGLPNPQDDNSPQERPWTEHIKPLLEIAIGNAYGLRTRNGGVFAAIEALNAALKPFQGRKNIIWMAHDGVQGTVDIATTLDRDGITVSSVDQGTFNAGTNLFVELTGGQVYDNDIEKAVKEAMGASLSSYVIEYNAPRPDGKYHKIRVNCSRKGVRLQVKQGYYAN